MALNKVKRAAFELIQSDARFFYTLTDMLQNAKGSPFEERIGAYL